MHQSSTERQQLKITLHQNEEAHLHFFTDFYFRLQRLAFVCRAKQLFFSPFFSSFLCSARFNPLLHHLNLLMLDFYQNTAVYWCICTHNKDALLGRRGKKDYCKNVDNREIRSLSIAKKKGTKGRWRNEKLLLCSPSRTSKYYMLSKKARLWLLLFV